MNKKNYAIYFIVFLLVTACSTKKNTFKNRSYHKMTAWFNTLFNGQEAMDKKLEELKQAHQDDYFEVLTIQPYQEFKSNEGAEIIEAPKLPKGSGIGDRLRSGNLMGNEPDSNRAGFEKAEEKALKAIANHSMTVKGKERNKLMARAYLMLGQARYYQGKPFQALDALEQVKKLPFDKHNDEADYFAALSQIQAGNKFAAAEILDKLYQNEDLDKSLMTNVAKEFAWLYFKDGDYASALNGLDKALENARGKKEKARINYIQGQILTLLGEIDKANAKFAKAYKLKPGFEMEARAKVFSALNYDPMVHNYEDYKKDLLKAYEVGTYETYRNEFLFALGKIEEKRDSIQLAEKVYQQALQEVQSSPRFRAETYAALGDLKFKQDDFVYATAYYDSASNAATAGKRKEEITLFRDNLRQVMDKYYLVQRNDSILRLTQMEPAERETYFKNYIEDLKEADAQKAAEEAVAQEENRFLTQTNQNSGIFQALGGGSGTFYFYSNTAKNNGEVEFKKIWGDRRLKDNWRTANLGQNVTEQLKAELTGNTHINNPRRYDVAFYLEQIPTDASRIQDIKVERDTVELSLGIDYADQFKSRKRATETLEHLVETPPLDDDVLLRAYYNLYRINLENNPVVSNRYKQLILEQYPGSLYAEFILNPQVDFTEGNDKEMLALYDKVYAAYKNENFDEVRKITEQAAAKNSKAEIMAKFLLINAYVDAKLLGKDAYMEALERIVLLYPQKVEGIHAKELLDDLKGLNEADAKVQDDSKKRSVPASKNQSKKRDIRNQNNNIAPPANNSTKQPINKDQDLRERGVPGGQLQGRVPK